MAQQTKAFLETQHFKSVEKRSVYSKKVGLLKKRSWDTASHFGVKNKSIHIPPSHSLSQNNF